VSFVVLFLFFLFVFAGGGASSDFEAILSGSFFREHTRQEHRTRALLTER
jgi:hypothetical protein